MGEKRKTKLYNGNICNQDFLPTSLVILSHYYYVEQEVPQNVGLRETQRAQNMLLPILIMGHNPADRTYRELVLNNGPQMTSHISFFL